LVKARHSLINLSIHKIKIIPAIGISGTKDKVAAKVTKPATVNPAAYIATKRSVSCFFD